MGFYSTTLEQPKVHQKTSDCGPKTASRNFFTYPVKTSYQNRSNFLIPNQEKSKTTHKTASGRSIWLGRDPVSERGGLNIYGFVVNDGINRRDMLGLSPDAPDCCKTEKKIWEVWTTAEIAANSIWIAAVLHEQYLVDQLAIFEAKLGPAQDDVNEKAQILLSANLAMPGLCMAGPISCAAGGVDVKKAYDMHITALGVLGGIKAVLEHLPAGIEAAAQDKQQKQSIWSHAFREMYKAESNYNVCVYKRDNP
jgi:hypothetical protein